MLDDIKRFWRAFMNHDLHPENDPELNDRTFVRSSGVKEIMTALAFCYDGELKLHVMKTSIGVHKSRVEPILSEMMKRGFVIVSPERNYRLTEYGMTLVDRTGR